MFNNQNIKYNQIIKYVNKKYYKISFQYQNVIPENKLIF